MTYLTVRIKGEDGHNIVPIESERVVLGRSSANDLQLNAEAVSRQHCSIYRFEGTWYVEDMGSSNGTRIRGEKIDKPTELEERSVIKCGHARLTFHLGSPPSRQPATERMDRTPVFQMQPGDPSEAFRCEDCSTWLSAAHRLPGDRMDCPRCGEEQKVPRIEPPEMAVKTGYAGADDDDDDDSGEHEATTS